MAAMMWMASTSVSATPSSPRVKSPAALLPAILLCLVGMSYPAASRAVTYLSAEDFLANSFAEVPSPNVLWLTPEMQQAATELLGHRYRGLRLRYWTNDGRSAWILDEIGKERPITIGVVVEAGRIAKIDILEYREPRGGEVRHPFFLEQFVGLELAGDGGLSGEIDGITGATLSVRAVTNISRFALFLHQAVVNS